MRAAGPRTPATLRIDGPLPRFKFRMLYILRSQCHDKPFAFRTKMTRAGATRSLSPVRCTCRKFPDISCIIKPGLHYHVCDVQVPEASNSSPWIANVLFMTIIANRRQQLHANQVLSYCEKSWKKNLVPVWIWLSFSTYVYVSVYLCIYL